MIHRHPLHVLPTPETAESRRHRISDLHQQRAHGRCGGWDVSGDPSGVLNAANGLQHGDRPDGTRGDLLRSVADKPNVGRRIQPSDNVVHSAYTSTVANCCSPNCGPGKTCATDNDCSSRFCRNSVCVPAKPTSKHRLVPSRLGPPPLSFIWTDGDGEATAVFMAATSTGAPAPVDGPPISRTRRSRQARADELDLSPRRTR